VWARYFFSIPFLLPLLVARYSPRQILAYASPLELLRGVSIVVVTVSYFGAIQYLPLADALGLLFVYPLLATGLAVAFLGERVKTRVLGLSVFSFLGAVLIIKPGFSAFNIGSVLALVAALAVSVNIVLSRKLSQTTPTLVAVFITSAVGLLAVAPIVPFFWVAPTSDQWWQLAILGAISALFSWLIYAAMAKAPATILAPFGFSEIVAVTIFGYLFFGDLPDGFSVLGIAVIIVAGIGIAASSEPD
ncbi:MAG: DMT family transporter, partial [Hyphomicrobiales bacterium]